MKRRIELDPQVVDYVRSLPPEPRHFLRLALRGLEDEKGDLRALEGELSGYWRLRVGPYRVIFRFFTRKGQRICRCVYAERRSIIYEAFSEYLRQELQE